MNIPSLRMVGWLRAAGESSRLRLLALCGERALSVTDLAQAMGQSEPRVSRHLKILAEAGLIERQRRGQWVHYRSVRTGEAGSFVQGLLAQLDRNDGQLNRDRAAVGEAAHAQAPVLAETRLGRALAALLERDVAPAGRVLIAGLTHPEVLRAAGARAGGCVALVAGRRAAQLARAYAGEHALECRVLESVSTAALSPEDLGQAPGPFDLVVLDRPAPDDDSLARALGIARAALAGEGRLWLFETYEALERSGRRVVEHPLARLRRLLRENGFACERLSPVEADGEHVLAACGRPAGHELRQGAA